MPGIDLTRYGHEFPNLAFAEPAPRVLEIAIAGGAWTDIISAGGSFNSGGYTRTLKSPNGCSLQGRSAWN